MLSTKLVVLLAAAASAQSSQSSATILDFAGGLFPLTTLTLQGSNSAATTYVESCTKGLVSGSYKGWETLAPSVSNVQLTAIPQPTGGARRRADSSASASCEPFTVIQGPEVQEFHMSDPRPGVWTWDQKCTWKGDLGKSDAVCSVNIAGSAATELGFATSAAATSVKGSELAAGFTPTAVAIVTPTSGSTSGSGSAPASTASSGAKSSASNAAAKSSAPSSAFAAAGPLPTGAMIFAGGAAGLFAAALAL